MPRKLCLLIHFFILLGLQKTVGQVKGNFLEQSQSLFIEFGGNSLLYSVNYERMSGSRGFRVGYGYTKKFFENPTFFVPGEFLIVRGKRNGKLELGVGLTYVRVKNVPKTLKNEFYLFGRVGYRYDGPNGFLFKIGFTPLHFFAVHHEKLKLVLPYAGASFGHVIN